MADFQNWTYDYHKLLQRTEKKVIQSITVEKLSTLIISR